MSRKAGKTTSLTDMVSEDLPLFLESEITFLMLQCHLISFKSAVFLRRRCYKVTSFFDLWFSHNLLWTEPSYLNGPTTTVLIPCLFCCIQVLCVDKFTLQLKNVDDYEQSDRDALGHWLPNSTVMPYFYQRSHRLSSDVVIPCLSRFWWNDRWWVRSRQGIIWSLSLLIEIESKYVFELLWHLISKLFSVRSCSVCRMLCFKCFCSPKYHTFRAAYTSISISDGATQQLCGGFLVLLSYTGPSELALSSWNRWLYYLWDLN